MSMTVDMDQALTSISFARIKFADTTTTADERGQLIAKWGNVFSTDGTQYEIDDVSYDAAKEAGRAAVADSVEYDGSKSKDSVNQLLFNPANGVGSAAALIVGNVTSSLTSN